MPKKSREAPWLFFCRKPLCLLAADLGDLNLSFSFPFGADHLSLGHKESGVIVLSEMSLTQAKEKSKRRVYSNPRMIPK